MVGKITRQHIGIMVVLSLALAALIATAFLGGSAAAPAALSRLQNGTIPQPGHFGGWLASIAVPPSGGDTIYLGEGSGLTVLDVSDKSQPHPIGSLPLIGDEITDITVQDDTAYLVNGDGLCIVDVTTPTLPSLVGGFNTDGAAQGLAVAGSYAFVTTFDFDTLDGWLQVVDVSGRSMTRPMGSYDLPGQAASIYLADPSTGSGQAIAYVADGDAGLTILDVSDPFSPTLQAAYDTSGTAERLQVSGGIAYIADGDSGLQIVDVSDPAHPAPLGAYDTPGYAQDVQVTGATVYVVDQDWALHVLDVSDPAHPAWLATYEDDWRATSVAVSGGYAYLGSGEQGLRILDVSDPASPAVLGAYERPSEIADAQTYFRGKGKSKPMNTWKGN